jgi:sec-independent protein translocase protein TatB
MFDAGFTELLLIGVVALVVIGPERLPGVARTVGKWLGKGKRMLSDVKAEIDQEIKADELKKILEVQKQNKPLQELIESTTESIKDIKSDTESMIADLDKVSKPSPSTPADATAEKSIEKSS